MVSENDSVTVSGITFTHDGDHWRADLRGFTLWVSEYNDPGQPVYYTWSVVSPACVVGNTHYSSDIIGEADCATTLAAMSAAIAYVQDYVQD